MVWLLALQVDVSPVQVDIPRDVIILIDVSGSMVKLDPEALAREGAKMVTDIASTLQASVKVSVVFYGETARLIIYRSDPAVLRKTLEDSLKNVKVEKYSDLLSALRLVDSKFSQSTLGGEAYVIILTDGRLEKGDLPPGTDLGVYKEELVGFAGRFKEKKWRVYSFSTSEPFEELKILSTLTGGDHAVIGDLKTLSQTFLDIIEAGERRFRLDLDHNSLVEFEMEKGVAEFSIVVAFDPKKRKVLRIYDPDGKEVIGERRSGRGFIIVKIRNPKPGKWKFEISKGATILLSMAVPRIVQPPLETPSTEPIPVVVKLVPITPTAPNWKHFSAKVYVEYPDKRQVVYRLYDDGKHGDGRAHDGIFGRKIPKLPEGEYMFTAVINHTPTRAEIRVKKKVKVVYMPILFADVDGQFIIGTPLEIRVGIKNRIKPIKSESYTVMVKDPKGQIHPVEVKKDRFGYWRGVFDKTFYGGLYEIRVGGRVVVRDSNKVRTFPHLNLKDTFSLCIAFSKSRIPSFLFFGEMPGRTYTHELTLMNHCDSSITINFTDVKAHLSDSLKDRGVPPNRKPQADTLTPVEIPGAVAGQPGRRVLKVSWRIPPNAVSGEYTAHYKGVQRPSYRPIRIRYDFKVGSWKQVYITACGVGAFFLGGGAAIWYFTGR